jgi:sugar lactone lactonase YvrE
MTDSSRASAGLLIAPGRTLIAFPSNEKGGPEGGAATGDGSVYAGLLFTGAIWRWDPDGTSTQITTLPIGGGSMLGFAVDADDRLHVALWSGSAYTNGIWRVDRDGRSARVVALPPEAGPNEIIFTSDGGMFVTDSPGAAIWRITPNGAAHRWISHDLLRAPADAPLPVGANGLDFWQRDLYVCNTFVQTIVRIPIQPDETPGNPEVVADQAGVSGLRLDADGNLWLASTFFTNDLTKLTPKGERITVATGEHGLDCPANLVFSPVPGHETQAYVTNTSTGQFGAEPSLLNLDLHSTGRANARLDLSR